MNMKRQPAAALSRALWANSSSDHERFAMLLSTAYSSEKGADMLDEVSALGYKFMYEGLWGVNAACNHISKTIVLDSYHRPENLAPAFIHEVNHALQFSRIVKDVSKLKAGDYIALHRALEADACAHQADFSYGLKDVFPQMYEEEMKSPIMRAYVSEIEKNGGRKKAMNAAFKAWYGFEKYQTSYEDQHCRDILHICSLARKDTKGGYFSETMGAADILNICSFEGKPYVEPSFLASDTARAVSEKGKNKLSEALADLNRATGIGDASVAALPVRGKKNPPLSLIQKVRGTGGR